jgi:NADH-quinone oxidoreductase subunit E
MILLEELEKIQKRHGYLKESELLKLSKNTSIPLSKIYGTATFYSFFKTQRCGKYIIRVCNNLPCVANGSENILKELRAVLGVRPGQITKDGKFSIETTSCIGCCNRAPAMMINSELFTDLDGKKLRVILKKLR